jgi:hypothetical protein
MAGKAKGPIDDKGHMVVTICSVFLGLTWVFTLLRCYTRIVLVRKFGTDDYLAVAAQVCRVPSRKRLKPRLAAPC